jgi:hypothetical protein
MRFQRECCDELSVRAEEKDADREPPAVGDPPLCQAAAITARSSGVRSLPSGLATGLPS